MTDEEIDKRIEKLEKMQRMALAMDESTLENINKKIKQVEKVRRKIEDLTCELEVEHFLEYGPEGKDPT
jgi:uncharacterized coiled-coil protein SlyX